MSAKESKTRRFHALYDRIYWNYVLWEAWRRVRRNGGAAGIDEETIQAIEQRGPGEFLAEIETALRAGQYRPSPVERQCIPKADGEAVAIGDTDATGSSGADGGEDGDKSIEDLPRMFNPAPAVAGKRRNSRGAKRTGHLRHDQLGQLATQGAD